MRWRADRVKHGVAAGQGLLWGEAALKSRTKGRAVGEPAEDEGPSHADTPTRLQPGWAGRAGETLLLIAQVKPSRGSRAELQQAAGGERAPGSPEPSTSHLCSAIPRFLSGVVSCSIKEKAEPPTPRSTPPDSRRGSAEPKSPLPLTAEGKKKQTSSVTRVGGWHGNCPPRKGPPSALRILTGRYRSGAGRGRGHDGARPLCCAAAAAAAAARGLG